MKENLELIESILNSAMVEYPVHYEVKNILVNYDSEKKHTTILAYPDKGSPWQVFDEDELRNVAAGLYDLSLLKAVIEAHKKFVR